MKRIILPFIFLSILYFPANAQDKIKVLISVDMEGIAGVVTGEQLGPSGFEYQRFRQFMTNEALAAMIGAKDAGATEIVIADSHGNGQNLLIEQFPEEVRIVRSWPRRFGMLGGLDETFDAVILIGYHSATSNKNGVRAHTFSSARLTDVKINGSSVSEGTYAAFLAGHFDIPVVMVTGDDYATQEVKELIPGVETTVVKEAYGFHSAKTYTPSRAVKMIRESAKRAIENRKNISPIKIRGDIDFDVSFKNYRPVEALGYLSILEKVDSHTIRFKAKNMVEVADFFVFLMEYGSSIEP